MKMLSLVIAEILIAQAYTRYMRAKSLQSCPTLCNPMDCSPPGSCIHGILQARILNGLPYPSPGDLPKAEIEPGSPALKADYLLSEPLGKPFIRFMLKDENRCCYQNIYIYIFDFGMSNLSFHPIDPHLFPTYTCTSFYQAKPVFLNSGRLCMV